MIRAERREKGWTMEVGEVKDYLARQGIRPSLYRVKIFHYLINEKAHPTAEEIFSHLKREIPTISLATVYNSLSLFMNKNIVQMINIEKNESRYDATLSWHGHFKCLSCGKVFDFHIKSLKLAGLEDFQIQGKQLNLTGQCSQCQKK